MKQKESKEISGVRPINSIQTKLILTIAITLGIVLCLNLFLFHNVNNMLQEVNVVFETNVEIVNLKEELSNIQTHVYEYLNTKSTDALEDYYRCEQELHLSLDELTGEYSNSTIRMMEQNIIHMILSYLETADFTVQSKRGRNIERYKSSYESMTELYGYINTYLYELNNQHFQRNSKNYQRVVDSLRVLEVLSLVVFAVAFIIGIIIMAVIIRAMIHPLTILSIAAHQVAEGDFEVEIPENESHDEVGIVTNAFSQMVGSLRDYIARVRSSMEMQAQMKERELSMEANLKDAQLKYLQAQINPHFLFNSLNAGVQLASMEDAEQTGIFMEKMADFFRYNLKKMEGDVTLLEEIRAADNYIYILNVRFAGDITYEKHISLQEEELESIRMPSMVLQPIVENAVQHGIHDRMERGIIRLYVDKEEDAIQVVVEDNGVGMSRQQIKDVQDGIVASHKEDRVTNGIALNNVISRLRLYYEKDDLFSIYSAGKDMGTEVTISLPRNTEAHALQAERGVRNVSFTPGR